MNRIFIIAICFLVCACTENNPKTEDKVVSTEYENIITEDYELVMPAVQEGLLILFPCFPCNAENTKMEFNILEEAMENNIAVLMMNFNQHLWLSETEKVELESILIEVVNSHKVDISNTFIGGFSSGGNVSLLLTNYLKSTKSKLQPKGLFIVDSPIDLLGLYVNAKSNIEKNFSKIAVEESSWIVESFDSEFGIGDSSIKNYENKSPFLSQTHSTKNISDLNGVKIRLYSEPDTIWWKKNRQTEYEGMNAYYIEQLEKNLNKLYGAHTIKYFKTENRGFRANGDRHPHSWAIVDGKNLIDWMLAK